MEVKLVARTLDVIEVFSQERRPLSLTELARLLDIPMSSCLGLIRTLHVRGYLYEVRKRGGYYPTKRLLTASLRIDSGDPLVSLVEEHLQHLQREVGETVVLGKMESDRILYLCVVESSLPIRYSTEVGTLRPLHANSIGQAILARMAESEAREILGGIEMPRFTDSTLVTPDDYVARLPAVRERGWSENLGESSDDLAALACAFNFAGEWYAVSIAGPMPRMQQRWESLSAPLLHCVAQIAAEVDPN
ncbi:TPA: IclR family transcriptional regulator [Pseudomonas aeruginosa]|uniref:IclR family transcriptional regulator n=1 Tax=Pseudomonas aeruginosa TaxID=287 RepID=UPI00136FB466|nr:IclR family transcriptional regulator [Pseudomonas aeruginosa]MXU51431.1 helix-turn-helix domain-containing protein [Pseudomonas aeruginosa]HBN9845809.1 IclR family transcriptional regulator [Pseudomonas aeruginosa]HBN9848326.1 IclR family transcriptional regulator [Pseudomonas aeruginosa]